MRSIAVEKWKARRKSKGFVRMPAGKFRGAQALVSLDQHLCQLPWARPIPFCAPANELDCALDAIATARHQFFNPPSGRQGCKTLLLCGVPSRVAVSIAVAERPSLLAPATQRVHDQAASQQHEPPQGDPVEYQRPGSAEQATGVQVGHDNVRANTFRAVFRAIDTGQNLAAEHSIIEPKCFSMLEQKPGDNQQQQVESRDDTYKPVGATHPDSGAAESAGAGAEVGGSNSRGCSAVFEGRKRVRSESRAGWRRNSRSAGRARSKFRTAVHRGPQFQLQLICI